MKQGELFPKPRDKAGEEYVKAHKFFRVKVSFEAFCSWLLPRFIIYNTSIKTSAQAAIA